MTEEKTDKKDELLELTDDAKWWMFEKNKIDWRELPRFPQKPTYEALEDELDLSVNALKQSSDLLAVRNEHLEQMTTENQRLKEQVVIERAKWVKHCKRAESAESRLSKAQAVVEEPIEDSPDVWQFNDQLYLNLPKFLIWKKRLEEALRG